MKVRGQRSTVNGHFTILSKNRLYEKVIEPLLSVRSTGSITVERVAKPMKNDVLSKFRQRLGEEHAEMCMCAGMNLCFLMNSRESRLVIIKNSSQMSNID